MKLFNQEEFETAKYRDLLKCKCDFCGSIFKRDKKSIRLRERESLFNHYCSKKCVTEGSLIVKGLKKSPIIKCKLCGGKRKKHRKDVDNTKNNFCSSSCAATYNNQNKTHGIRRSKLEIYLEDKLIEIYKDFEIHFNRKDSINSELDIYIPSLKLAFELNGIFHYEPIFGEDKLSKIENNDQRKFQACIENNIELCIIDASSQKYFKESSSQKFLDIIVKIIKEKVENGIEPSPSC